jgi:hypothetical protein
MRNVKWFWAAIGGFVVGWALLILGVLRLDLAAPTPTDFDAPAVSAAAPASAGPGPIVAPPPPALVLPAPTAPKATPAAQVAESDLVAGLVVPDLDAEDREQVEKDHQLLRSTDPDQRIDAITSLVELDPAGASQTLDSLLQSPESNEDVRVEAFERLNDLNEGSQKVNFLMRSLRDPSPKVREEAAWQLSFEDEELYPKIVSAVHAAYQREHDPDALRSMETTLESKDPTFVAPDAPQLLEPEEAGEVDTMASAEPPPQR